MAGNRYPAMRSMNARAAARRAMAGSDSAVPCRIRIRGQR
jgi:hypothetical protein